MPEEVLEVPVPNEKSPEGSVTQAVQPESVTPAFEEESGAETALERKSEQYTKLLSQVGSNQSTSDDEIEADAHAVGAVAEAEAKVHKLVELAQVKGVAHAVRVAKRMNDLYVLDTMHDELADKLYEGLLSKGLITKE